MKPISNISVRLGPQSDDVPLKMEIFLARAQLALNLECFYNGPGSLFSQGLTKLILARARSQ